MRWLNGIDDILNGLLTRKVKGNSIITIHVYTRRITRPTRSDQRRMRIGALKRR